MPTKAARFRAFTINKPTREIIKTADNHFANEIAVLKEELTKKNVIYPAWEFWTTGEKRFSTESAAKIVSHPLANDGKADRHRRRDAEYAKISPDDFAAQRRQTH